MHQADPFGVSQLRRVGMMLECSTGELLARAAFMHHDDQEYDALRYHAALKGLRVLSHRYTTVNDSWDARQDLVHHVEQRQGNKGFVGIQHIVRRYQNKGGERCQPHLSGKV